MNVAIASIPAPNGLTAAEKFRTIHKRDRVQLKIMRLGKDPIWVGGYVKEHPNKGGAYCKTDQGTEKFFHWNEIKPAPEEEKNLPDRPFASLGEIVSSKNQPLRALPPFLDTQPPPEPAAQVPPPPPPSRADAPPRSDVLLVSRKDLEAMNGNKSDSKRQRHAHQLTPIGDLFRRKRLEKGQSQLDIAEVIGLETTTNSRISQIELGKVIPSDDELQAFAEAFAISLDEVLSLRDESIEARSDARSGARLARSARPESEATTMVSSSPAPIVTMAELAPSVASTTRTLDTFTPPTMPDAPAPVAAATPVDDAEAYADFCLELGTVAPVPRESDQRKLWFAMARKFYEFKKK